MGMGRSLMPRRAWWTALALGSLWAALLLVPVLAREGWPVNHDGLAPVVRMAALLGQWKEGHWIALWSTQQQAGFGSPMLGLYHKLHMYFSAGVLAATGSVKAALVVPVGVFMVAGFCGMAFCLRQVLPPRHHALAWIGAALLPVSNYATTDWLVRGAMAEFAAMMLLPWLFAWCLLLLRTGRWRPWIGVLLALLALAHATLALFGLIPLGIAFLLACRRWGTGAWQWRRPAFWSVLCAVACLLPFVAPTWALARFSRVDRLLLHGLTPATSGQPWAGFFWDPAWRWGGSEFITLQLDLALWALLAVFLAAWVRSTRDAPQPGGSAAAAGDQGVAWFLALTLAAMAWLQTPWSHWLYALVPGAQYLQFAWRLLAYLTVALIVCAVIGLAWCGDLLARRWPGMGARAGAALALLVLACTAKPKMWWHLRQLAWYPQEQLTEALGDDNYWAFGEFLPLVDWTTGPGLLDAQSQAIAWMAALPAQTCTLAEGRAPGDHQERRAAFWRVQCPQASEVMLPVFLAPGMELEQRGDRDGRWAPAAMARTCSDPRVRIALPAGETLLHLRYPNWRRTVLAALRRQPFDFRRDCAD